jgi:hypothetical protein
MTTTTLALVAMLLAAVATYHNIWRQSHDDIPDDPWLDRFGTGYEGQHRD